MIFLYIKELQNRIILLFIAYICLLCSLFFYKEVLLFVVVLPVLKSTGSTMFYFIYTNFSELFEVYLYLSFLSCNFVFYILLLFHVICFLIPGHHLAQPMPGPSMTTSKNDFLCCPIH